MGTYFHSVTLYYTEKIDCCLFSQCICLRWCIVPHCYSTFYYYVISTHSIFFFSFFSHFVPYLIQFLANNRSQWSVWVCVCVPYQTKLNLRTEYLFKIYKLFRSESDSYSLLTIQACTIQIKIIKSMIKPMQYNIPFVVLVHHFSNSMDNINWILLNFRSIYCIRNITKTIMKNQNKKKQSATRRELMRKKEQKKLYTESENGLSRQECSLWFYSSA